MKKSHKWFLGFFFGLMAISLLIESTKSPEKNTSDQVVKESRADDEAQNQIEKSPTNQTQNASKANLGLKPEEFRKAYNNQIGKVDKSWRIAEFDIGEGDVNNAFNAPLGKAAYISGSVDKKTGHLIDLLVLAGGGSPEENLQAVAAMLSVAHASTQGASKEEISNTVSQLMQAAMDSMDDKKNKPTTANIGNRTFTFAASKITGLMFAITDAKTSPSN